jgi:hypothetical protein
MKILAIKMRKYDCIAEDFKHTNQFVEKIIRIEAFI